MSCRAEVGFIQSVLKDYGWDDQFEVVYEVLDKDTYDGNIPDADLEFMVDDINDEWIAEASREEDEYIKDTFSNWGGILHLSGWCYSWAVHELTGSDYVREIEFYVQYPKDTDSRDAMKDMRSIIEDLTSKKDNPYQYDVAVWMGDPPAGHRTVSPEYIREVLGV
ncbi:MAG: hypothetical protein HDQ88_02265 [Clostridia bacterium]|nr:hypothetical protein [Clostridia bacterium]